MTGQIILPPNYPKLENSVIFLAGPIQGALDWQKEAIKYIQREAPELNIANPRREILPEEFIYAKQVDWETHYLNKASKNGVIMFWLAKENEHLPRRAYAQTSRFELGEWKVKHETKGIKLVIGIEEGFSNSKYIKRRISQDCPKIKICTSLKETCQEAINLIG